VQRLERTLHDALHDASLVVLDLRWLAFMDLTGLRVILDGARFARESGRKLHLLRGASRVDRIFALTGTAETVNTVELDVELGQLSAR